MNKAEALKVFYEIHDKCKSCLMNCVNPNVPSSQIEETRQGYQIIMRCELDSYSIRCLAPIVSKYNLALTRQRGQAVIS
jgi:hypothetical protein